MNKRIHILALILMTCVSSFSQINMSEKMNEIKMSPDYEWGQYSWMTQDSAYYCAEQRLMDIVNHNVPDEQRLDIKDLSDKLGCIKRERTNNQNQVVYTVFLYVKKSDLAELRKRIKVTEAPKKEDSRVSESMLSDLSFIESIANEVMFAVDLTKEIMGQSSVRQILNLLKEKVENKEIRAFGPVSTAKEIDDLYLIICDKETLAPKAVLSDADESGERTNIETGKLSTMEEYAGNICIWVRI